MVKEMLFKISPTPPQKKILPRAHLINSRLLYEAGSVGRQQSMCGHDVNLIGSSFFQDLCSSNKVSNIIYDVILEGWGGGERIFISPLCFKSAWV